MGRRHNRFVWTLVIIFELSGIMGVGSYFLTHRDSQPEANIQSDVAEASLPNNPPPLQEKKTTDKMMQTLSSNIGGPYLVSSPLHISIYRAKKGDSIAEIAKRNNLDIFTILSVNNLKTANDISIGQKLRVPNQRGIMHRVREGETLEDIALMYNVNMRRIIRVNQILDPEEIKPNTELFIPDAKLTVAFTKELLEKSGVRISAKRSGSRRTSVSRFVLPYKRSEINSHFGFRKDPFTRRRAFHAGVDIDSGYGANVYAAMDGVVTYAGWMGGYGKLVVITDKNGYSTRYGHLARITVKRGAYVNQGDRIGTVGNTGRSTGPHLHFEVRKDDKPLDPAKFVSSSASADLEIAPPIQKESAKNREGSQRKPVVSKSTKRVRVTRASRR